MAATGVEQMGDGHPPRFADRLVSARHADVPQMGRPPELRVIADQELAPPNGPVGPQARAVERDADHRFIQAVLGHATGHVGMVMLDGHERRPVARRALPRVVARRIIGVQVVNDHSAARSQRTAGTARRPGQRPGRRPNGPSRPCDD